MTQEDLLNQLLTFCKNHPDIESADRVDDEDAIGVELRDGTEYFIEIQEA